MSERDDLLEQRGHTHVDTVWEPCTDTNCTRILGHPGKHINEAGEWYI